MGKALVVKNVDFGTNKLTTVTFDDEIPCTGIVLNKDTTTLENIGTTETLIATVTPADTTDAVVWSTSDPDVIDVVGGILTVVGVGEVTITATCGSCSAICEVTSTNEVSFDYYLTDRWGKSGTGDVMYASIASGGDAYSVGFKHSGESQLLVANLIDASDHIYPIMLSKGASKLSFDVPSNVRATVCFTSTTTPSSQYGYYVGVMGGDASAWDSAVATGERTVDIPSGADSFIFTFHKPNSTMTQEIVQGCTITES